MVKKRKKIEERYYPVVSAWFVKKGYYCGEKKGRHYGFENKGTEKLKADVAGVKNVGDWLLDEVEIAIAEVKDLDTVSLRHLNQALAYSCVAHKCYLATTAEIDQETINNAARLGVGLLQLEDKYTRPKEKLSPQTMQPNKSIMLNYLRSLGFEQCTFCKCYFWKRGNHLSFEREKQFSLLHGYRRIFLKEKERNDLDWEYKTRRYVCDACKDEFILKSDLCPYFETLKVVWGTWKGNCESVADCLKTGKMAEYCLRKLAKKIYRGKD